MDRTSCVSCVRRRRATPINVAIGFVALIGLGVVSIVLTSCARATPAAHAVDKGLDCQRRGEYREAVTEFSNAIKLDPKKAIAYAGRGHANYALGDYRKAIADFNKAITLQPE